VEEVLRLNPHSVSTNKKAKEVIYAIQIDLGEMG
jgi:hypothetical protein